MEYDGPTAADYANHNAQQAQQKAQANSGRISELEARVEALEKVLRERGLLPGLELDPEPWVWIGERFGTNDRPEIKYVKHFEPRKGYEQDRTKYEEPE